MKCRNCSADLADGTEKCPFCKEILFEAGEGIKGNFDFKYTITSKEQMKIIRDAVNASGEKKKLSLKRRFKNIFRRKREKKKEKIKIKKLKSAVKKISPQNKMYMFFYGSIFLILMIIAGIWFAAGAVANRARNVFPVIYAKENSLFMQYEKKNILLTDNAVDLNNLFSDNSEENKENPEGKSDLFRVLSDENTVKKSDNGMYVYYFENYDEKKHSGSLIRIFNGKNKRVVSNDVFNSYVLSKNGKEILFLQSTDENGDMGNLCYWNEKLKEPVRISSDIDKNMFKFSENDKKIIYLRNYDHRNYSGDLCVVSTDKSADEGEVIDSGVYAFFGTDKSGENYLYSKNYKADKKNYDLYLRKSSDKAVKLFEAAEKEPVVPKKGSELLVYAYDDGVHSILYSVNLKNYKKNKIAQMTDVLKSDDENKRIIFNKVQENSVTDCYYYETGRKILKIADNITAVSEENKTANLFTFSENFKYAAYITSFDNGKAGGKLCFVDLTAAKDNITEVSDDVFSCYISKDGKKLYFCKDYSKARQTFDVYAYERGKTHSVAEDVEGSFFMLAPNRKSAVYIKDADVEGDFGTLYVTDRKDRAKKSYEKTGAFAVTDDGSIIIFNDYNDKKKNWTIYRTNTAGDKEKLIGESVNGLVCY